MKDLNVRRAVAGDAATIARLWMQCTREVARLEPVFTPAVDARRLAGVLKDELAAARRLAWVALQDDRLAGYVTCRMEDGATIFVERRYLYVIDLDVSPDFRGRGLSRLLMNEVEWFARENGIRRLELAYAARDPRAQKVWARHGFEPYFVHVFKTLD